MSIESVMSSKYLTLCHPLLLLPSISPSIRVFSNESALHIRLSIYDESDTNLGATGAKRKDAKPVLSIYWTCKMHM